MVTKGLDRCTVYGQTRARSRQRYKVNIQMGYYVYRVYRSSMAGENNVCTLYSVCILWQMYIYVCNNAMHTVCFIKSNLLLSIRTDTPGPWEMNHGSLDLSSRPRPFLPRPSLIPRIRPSNRSSPLIPEQFIRSTVGILCTKRGLQIYTLHHTLYTLLLNVTRCIGMVIVDREGRLPRVVLVWI